ncbi:DUF4197 family protein [uncultured Sphaerochaeta sp.]|uniref:DUF4197 family protein n=1 Tax=uncultured Sphaerochaeta sp. TaxID=886478 RepID=UPI002A0A3405|nr:DUF4197 family protein [uncultured Sphaerochaeta sp.]
MKRYIVLVILIVLLVGCKSTSTKPEDKTQKLRSALLTAVTEASQAVPATLHEALTNKDLLPPSSQILLEQNQIPGMEKYLALWHQQVLLAFRKTTIQVPDLLKPYIDRLQIDDPVSVLHSSDTSISKLLNQQFGIEISQAVQELLAKELEESQNTYAIMYDRYGIWSQGITLLGKAPLPQIAKDPTSQLTTIFVATYVKQLSQEESNIRTTPTLQGTGSLYETFQQELIK